MNHIIFGLNIFYRNSDFKILYLDKLLKGEMIKSTEVYGKNKGHYITKNFFVLIQSSLSFKGSCNGLHL
jgi:hypothetical protein